MCANANINNDKGANNSLTTKHWQSFSKTTSYAKCDYLQTKFCFRIAFFYAVCEQHVASNHHLNCQVQGLHTRPRGRTLGGTLGYTFASSFQDGQTLCTDETDETCKSSNTRTSKLPLASSSTPAIETPISAAQLLLSSPRGQSYFKRWQYPAILTKLLQVIGPESGVLSPSPSRICKVGPEIDESSAQNVQIINIAHVHIEFTQFMWGHAGAVCHVACAFENPEL